MSNLISNSDLTMQLERLLPNCKELTIISAFMTQPATSWLSRLTYHNKPKVELIGRFTPNDFAQGASDINALRECINNGFSVKALSNLHAKIYQIDQEIIFNGSANLTGKGLAIVNNSNLESCSRVEASEASKIFITKIAESAIPLTLVTLDRMDAFLKELNSNTDQQLPVLWPEEILSNSSELFVSDFPLGQPGKMVNEYMLNPSLSFAQIENIKDNYADAEKIFKQSKAYQWIKKQIKNNKSDRDLGFGQISSLLHDVLADDPGPYRQEVKNLQINLYLYLKLYATDEVEVYVPGNRSEVIKFKNEL
ncbi:phospholipase D family protein [Shewanella sp. CAL98-MNA-CIBAN-0140]|jgi:phosphatidylserine/phosphatidylglycerophosphate/cardiolipin synthase-like enzyme|uniref:phospholipase D family protein n=2 Tax=Gammaproteobacteria TaxID=1236 RepID=UPI0033287475